MIRATIVAVLCSVASVLAAGEDDPTASSVKHQPPAVTVLVNQTSDRSKEIPASIEDKNPHEVVVYFNPDGNERHEVARYTVVLGERPEWVTTRWENYEFHTVVNLPDNAVVRVHRDGEPLFHVFTSVRFSRPKRDPMDPEVMRNRLDHMEKRQRVSNAIQTRTREVLFRHVEDHWLDANCELEENEWGVTNEWIRRQLDLDIVEAQHPFGIDDYSNSEAEEFFAQWRPGDRLFSFQTPDHLGIQNERGYLIVRECRIVAKHGWFFCGLTWTTQE